MQKHSDSILEKHRNLDQLARYLGVHPVSIRRWRIRREGPPALKLGNKIYFPKDQTEAWLRARIEGAR